MDTYTKAYICQIERARRCRALPWALACRLGIWLGRYGSFLLQRQEQIVTSMQNSLGIDHAEASHQFRLLCESAGVALQMVWRLAHISNIWLDRQVEILDPEAFREIGQSGGVILSHHSYHHNLLISLFKRSGRAAFPIGNPPTAFSADDYLYHFTLSLNQATETNLSGGRWLYNDQGKAFVQGIRQVLESRQILLVFCDFNEVRKTNPVYPFLGKTLQIPSGVIRLVDKENVPVYFAGFRRQPPGGYALSLQKLQTRGVDPGAPPLAEQYVAALEHHVRQHPSSWQCWEIF